MPKNGFKKKLLTVPNLGKIYTVKYQIWGNSAAALRGLWQPSQFQFHQKSESTETAMLSSMTLRTLPTPTLNITVMRGKVNSPLPLMSDRKAKVNLL